MTTCHVHRARGVAAQMLKHRSNEGVTRTNGQETAAQNAAETKYGRLIKGLQSFDVHVQLNAAKYIEHEGTEDERVR